MAKTVTIQTSHEYSSKGKTITVEEALAWVAKHETKEVDGEEVEKYSPGDLICYAVNRLKALSKDNKRYEKGELATRLYAPRVDQVGGQKPRGLPTLVESIHDLQPDEPKAKPAKKAAKKPAKKPRKAKVTEAPKAANPEAAAAL